MQEQNEQTTMGRSPKSDSSQRQAVKVLFCLNSVALLLNVALASAALNYAAPKVVDGRQGIAARVNWYLHSGQLQADVRSLASALDYIMEIDRDVPATTNLAVLPLTEDLSSSEPKS